MMRKLCLFLTFCALGLIFVPWALAVPTGTGGHQLNLGSDAGDDLAVDSDKFVVEGDTGEVGLGVTDPGAKLEVGDGTGTFIDGTNDILVADDVEIDGALYVAEGVQAVDGTYTHIGRLTAGDATFTDTTISALTASRCIETDANKKLVSAAGACAAGGGEFTDGGEFMYPSDDSGVEDVVLGGTTIAGSKIYLDAGVGGVTAVNATFAGIGRVTPGDATFTRIYMNTADMNNSIGVLIADGTTTGLGAGLLSYFSHAAAGTALPDRSGYTFYFTDGRGDDRTSGATNDDYDTMHIYKWYYPSGAGGTMNAAGSALHVATDPYGTLGGTLNDTTHALKVSHGIWGDAPGKGDAVYINNNMTATSNSISIEHAGTGNIAEILAEKTDYTATMMLLMANEETTGDFTFLNFKVDQDGTPTTVFRVDDDGHVLASGYATFTRGVNSTPLGNVVPRDATFTDVKVTGSLQIPNSTSPTVNAAGEIAEDTVANQLLVGAAPQVHDPRRFFSMTIESPADADNILWFKAPFPMTITNITCGVDPAGTGESAVIDVQERDAAGDNPASVDASITCDNDGAADDGAISNSGIDSGDWMSLDVGTVTGTVSQVFVTVTYKVERELL